LLQELLDESECFIIEDFDALSPFFFYFFVWMIKEALPLKATIYGLINAQAKDLILGNEEKQNFFSLLQRQGAFIPFEIDFSDSAEITKPSVSLKIGTRVQGWSRAFLAYEDLLQWSAQVTTKNFHPFFAVNVVAGYLKTGRWNECQDMIKEFEKNNVDLSAHRWVLLCILALASHNSGDNNLAFDHLESGRKALSKSLSKDELGFLMVLSSFLEEKLWESKSMWKKLENYHQTLEERCPSHFTLVAKTSLAYYMAVKINISLEKAIDYAKKSMGLAHNIGNTYSIARLYHMLGFLNKTISSEKAKENFENGIQLRIQLGHRLGLVKDYNGVGYFYFSTGDFGKSLLYFQKALESLEGEKNYIEIGMTLFNIGQTYFHSGNFSAALEIFQRILDILENQAIKTMPFHSALKLNALCCITAYYQNWRTTATEYWQKLQSFTLDPAALPFFYFAKAIFSKMEGNYGLAIQSLEEGIKETNLRDLQHLKFNMELEMYLCYGHLQQTHNQKVIIEEIEKQLSIHGSFETEKLYQHIRYGGKVENFVSERQFNNDIRNLSINISNIAKKQATMHNLNRREKRLKFLKHFTQEVSSRFSKNQILKKGATMIQEEFGFDIFILSEDEAAKIWFRGEKHHKLPEGYAYSQFWSGRTKPQAKTWINGSVRTAIFPFEAQENNRLWFYVQSKSGKKGFHSEDIEILFLAAEHWNTVLDLRNTKDHNRILVKTDYLTGINARGEILRLAEKERKRCIRYSKSRSRRFFFSTGVGHRFFPTVQ
jgi:tetratricopeptide (TPR) repeat protein